MCATVCVCVCVTYMSPTLLIDLCVIPCIGRCVTGHTGGGCVRIINGSVTLHRYEHQMR